ncbi:MAG: EscU/YscU/HrcU family type III secretion system export apparatus switch protein [Candidatus Sedimenticola sp. (ex Thyasira tokunagai)]
MTGKSNEAVPKRVVGLKYEKEQGIPRVILKGYGYQAEEIITKGKTISNKKVIEDEKLLKQLYKLPIDAEIGAELFELVAILLVHVYGIDELTGERK